MLEQLRFNEQGLIVAVAQEADSGEVLMQAYMNKEAVAKTLETGLAHYYSRSRQKLWQKGESSGHCQYLQEMRYDCDGDCLLLLVKQAGVACHTGHSSCFYRRLTPSGEQQEVTAAQVDAAQVYAQEDILDALYHVIQQRRQEQTAKESYVASLFAKGLDKILGKIGEEATETAVAGKGGQEQEVVAETADLWFHSLVLLAAYDLHPERIYAELRQRFGLSGIAEKAQRNAPEA